MCKNMPLCIINRSLISKKQDNEYFFIQLV